MQKFKKMSLSKISDAHLHRLNIFTKGHTFSMSAHKVHLFCCMLDNERIKLTQKTLTAKISGNCRSLLSLIAEWMQHRNYKQIIQIHEQIAQESRWQQDTYFNLFNSWSLEAEIKAVVAEAAYLLMVSVVAHADDGNLAVFYQLNQFLHVQCHVVL